MFHEKLGFSPTETEVLIREIAGIRFMFVQAHPRNGLKDGQSWRQRILLEDGCTGPKIISFQTVMQNYNFQGLCDAFYI
jgi:hypothetical protein